MARTEKNKVQEKDVVCRGAAPLGQAGGDEDGD